MDETEDINRLIRELNADRPGSFANAGEPSEAVRLDRWLEELVQLPGRGLAAVRRRSGREPRGQRTSDAESLDPD